jgi:hypothetical protein
MNTTIFFSGIALIITAVIIATKAIHLYKAWKSNSSNAFNNSSNSGTALAPFLLGSEKQNPEVLNKIKKLKRARSSSVPAYLVVSFQPLHFSSQVWLSSGNPTFEQSSKPEILISNFSATLTEDSLDTLFSNSANTSELAQEINVENPLEIKNQKLANNGVEINQKVTPKLLKRLTTLVQRFSVPKVPSPHKVAVKLLKSTTTKQQRQAVGSATRSFAARSKNTSQFLRRVFTT